MNYIKKIFQFPAPLKNTYPIIWILPFVFLVTADLVSKKLITNNLTFNLQHQQLYQHLPLPKESRNTLLKGIRKIDILGEDGKYIKLRLVFNDRFAFSLGPSNFIVSFFISFFAIIFLFFYRAHNPLAGHPLAWLSVFSGALGNLIDKMFIKSLITREWVFSLSPRKGYVHGVVDFIECIWFGWDSVSDIFFLRFLSWPTWPIFNLADSLVTTGIVLLILTMMVKK